jgi:hypothetical protein
MNEIKELTDRIENKKQAKYKISKELIQELYKEITEETAYFILTIKKEAIKK